MLSICGMYSRIILESNELLDEACAFDELVIGGVPIDESIDWLLADLVYDGSAIHPRMWDVQDCIDNCNYSGTIERLRDMFNALSLDFLPYKINKIVLINDYTFAFTLERVDLINDTFNKETEQ